MNSLAIVGRIGKVQEMRYTQGGKAVLNFSLAVDNGKTPDGEKRPATWFEIALWEKQAENLAQYLAVGNRVGVTGQVRLQIDNGNDGQKYPKLTVDFPRVELLGDSGAAQQTQAAPRQAARPPQGRPAQRPAARPAGRPAPPWEITEEDIPF